MSSVIFKMSSLRFWSRKNRATASVTVTPTESDSNTLTETPRSSKESTEKEEDGAKRISKWCFWRKKKKVQTAAVTESLTPTLTKEPVVIMENEGQGPILSPRQRLLCTKWLRLPNLGGNCYANAALQCLFRAETFCEDLLDMMHIYVHSNSMADYDERTLNFAPEGLIRCFLKLWKVRISTKDQELCHTCEYLRELINSVGKVNPVFSIDKGNDPTIFLRECLIQMEASLKTLDWGTRPAPRCPIRSNFKIGLMDITTCSSCGHQQRSNLQERHLLFLPLVKDSVDKCFFDVVNNPKEKHSKCRICGGESASFVTTFHTLPKFLILKLERARHINGTITMLKNAVFLDTELQINTLEQSCSVRQNYQKSFNLPAFLDQTHPKEGGSTFTYRLISILSIFAESIMAGHTLTDCCSHDPRKWICYSDTLITVIKEKKVLRRRQTVAYGLLYERVSTD